MAMEDATIESKRASARLAQIGHDLAMRTGRALSRGLALFLAQQSLIEDRPVLDNEDFPFLARFEAEWPAIREEAQRLLAHRAHIPAFQELSPEQARLTRGEDWKTFILYGFGERAERNCLQAPRTAALLAEVPGMQTAMFSILAPRSHIAAHRGVTKGFVRVHVGLIVPREAEHCRIRIGSEQRVWSPGRGFVFDDTYEHEVWNDTDEERVILLFDIDRPMRFWGRLLNATFISFVKLSAFYRTPRRAIQSWEARFEAATRNAQSTLESMSEPAEADR